MSLSQGVVKGFIAVMIKKSCLIRLKFQRPCRKNKESTALLQGDLTALTADPYLDMQVMVSLEAARAKRLQKMLMSFGLTYPTTQHLKKSIEQ